MRKNYALLKQSLAVLTLFIAVSVIIYSCKKDSTEFNISSSTISELQNWYQENANSKANVNNRFKTMVPIWENVFVSDQGEQVVYEVELQNPDKIFQVINPGEGDKESEMTRNKVKLLIFKNKETSNIAYGAYLSILNEGDFLDLNQLHYKAMNNLSGKVMYYNFDGSLSNGWNYSSGRPSNGISPIDKTEYINLQLDKLSAKQHKGVYGREKLLRALTDDCNGWVTDYGIACVEVGGHIYCTLYEKGTSFYSGGCGGGSAAVGGEGGGYTPPGGGGATAPYFDCAGVRNGKAYLTDCGCIGGNTGIESCAQKEIIDSLKNYPCAQALIKQLPLLKNDIAVLIKKTFGVSDVKNIIFKADNSLIGTSEDGNHSSGNYVQGNTTEQNVGLNPDILNHSSKEYILVTMYHEALHAYFSYKKQELGSIEFAKQFSGLSVNGGRLLFMEQNGHFEMAASNYLLGLRDAILSYNKSMDPAVALALAKGGIVNLTQGDSTVNANERDIRKGLYKGTKCN